MGNSSSQTVHLRPTGLSSSTLFNKDGRNSRWPQKFASPGNRVLPPPVAGQRLRTTDNGHILQNGGTISGRRLAMLLHQRARGSDEEYEDDPAHGHRDKGASMLYGHRKSHSDPDIIRSMIRNKHGGSESPPSKSVIAVSPSKAKIKSRKKGRAPDPPPQSNTLPRELDRMPLYSRDHLLLSQLQGSGEVVRTKSPAPLPPGQQRHFAKNKMSKSATDLRSPDDSNHSEHARSSSMGRQEPQRKSMSFEPENNNNSSNRVQGSPGREVNGKLARSPHMFQTFQQEIMVAVKKKAQFRAAMLGKESSFKGNVESHSPIFSELVNTEDIKKAWSEEIRRAEELEARRNGKKNAVGRREGAHKNYPDHDQGNYSDDDEYLQTNGPLNDYSPRSPRTPTGSREIQDQSPCNAQEKSSPGHIQDEVNRLGKRRTKDAYEQRNMDYSRSPKNKAPSKHFKSADNEKPNYPKFNGYESIAPINIAPNMKENTQNRKSRNRRSRDYEALNYSDNSARSPRDFEHLERVLQDPVENRSQKANDLSQPKLQSNGHDHYVKEVTQNSLQEYAIQKKLRGNHESRQITVRDHNVQNINTESVERRNSQPRSSPRRTDSVRSLGSSRYSSGSQSDTEEIVAILKPTLPRPCTEMPRFSPTQAWKSLIVIDQPAAPYLSDVSSDDGELGEERIRPQQRVVAPRRIATERCTDSGISPDLPTGTGRHPGVGRPATPPGQTWTPQQDLEDSDAGSVDIPQRREPDSTDYGSMLHAKLTLPQGMFPASRQPDNAVKEKQKRQVKKKGDGSSHHFNSLRSLKKVLGLKLKTAEATTVAPGLDTNWSLSRSNPTISAGIDSKEGFGRSPSESALNVKKDLERTDSRPLSDGYLIYLPEYDTSYNGQVNEVTRHGRVVQTKKKNRFSYQNTVRREVKKLVDEKISAEVALKERQREKEIEWMNKVEEEFRKRRDKEKINIRYQLKMLSDEDTGLDSGEWEMRDVTEREVVSLPFIPTNSPHNNHKKAYHMENSQMSNSSTSSPDLVAQQWSQPVTGMSKWLRRQKSKEDSVSCMNSNTTRPEPEGGRSSSDEHRSLELNNSGDKTRDLFEPEGEHYSEQYTLLSQRFESHQVNESNVPNRQQTFSNFDFQNELLEKTNNTNEQILSAEEDAAFSRSHPHRNAGRVKNAVVKVTPEKTVLSPQPFNPNQAYRPIPFDLGISKRSPNKTNGDMYSRSQHIRTAVEAR